MRQHRQQTMTDRGQAGKSECPFVGLKEPFIDQTKPLIIPSVCRNIPSVCNRTISGFTLVELLITVIIAAVLFSLAIPEMGRIIKNSRITTQTNDLLADLNFARSEAIKRNRTVVVCKSADPTAGTPSCDTVDANPWSTGRLIFVDVDANNAYAVATDTLLRLTEPLAGNNSLNPDATTSSLKNFVAYARTGITTIPTSSTQHFAICDDRGDNFARGVTFEPTGRAKIVRKSTFAALSCP